MNEELKSISAMEMAIRIQCDVKTMMNSMAIVFNQILLVRIITNAMIFTFSFYILNLASSIRFKISSI